MEENNVVMETGSENETVKTYTQEEVDKLLQSEVDRRITSALKKQEIKNQQKIAEAEKLAKMNEQDKYEYTLKQREAAILEKEKALALAENKNEASKILAERGISLQLVEFIVAEDAETMYSNIDLLDKAFKASVKAEVEKRLGSNSPKKNLTIDEGMTRERFNKLSLIEQQKLATENPDLISSLYK